MKLNWRVVEHKILDIGQVIKSLKQDSAILSGHIGHESYWLTTLCFIICKKKNVFTL